MKSKNLYKAVKTLEVLEGADNYNSWIASRLKPYIKSPALEIGAGTGNISEFFTGLSELTLTDVDETLVAHLSKRFVNKNVRTEVFDVSKRMSKVKNLFKTIYSVNVLEHIKDDENALRNMNRMLKAGGKVVVLVPAKKAAFKSLDRHLGHYRRYEKGELSKKLVDSGFKIEYIGYFNMLGLLSWIVRDYVGGGSPNLKPSHVKFFDFVVPFLREIEPIDGLPVGISLIAVGKKL